MRGGLEPLTKLSWVGFFHRADVDGIFSAAIFLTTHPQAQVFFTNYGSDEIARMCRLVRSVSRSKRAGRIVVADIHLTEAVVEVVVEALEFAKSRGWRILWLDHHRWDPKVKLRLKTVASVEIDTRRCAADLVWSRTAYKNSTARSLAQIAHVIDLGKKGPGSGAMLTDIITHYNHEKNRDSKLVKLARQISQGTLWTLVENDPWRKYVKDRETKITSLIDNTRAYRVGKFQVAIGKSHETIGSSKACRTILEKSKADIGVMFTRRGRLSLRRKDGAAVPLNKIAEAINPMGGGHEFAAGSFLGFRVRSREDARKARRIILSAIRNTLT